jgi:hypothetical protein
VRVRRNVNADTPLPPEITHALNPPDGAILYYWLGAKPAGEVTIEILDSAGRLVRHLSSVAAPPVPEAARPPFPNYWLAEPSALAINLGTNRANWDLRYDPPPVLFHSYDISANYRQTPVQPEGPLAPPGRYRVRLSVDGKRYEQPLVVRNDPRSPATLAALEAQHGLLQRLTWATRASWEGYQEAFRLRSELDRAIPSDAPADLRDAAQSVRARLDSLMGAGSPSFRSLNGSFASQLTAQDNADQAPTPAMLAAYGAACRDLARMAARWGELGSSGLGSLNQALTRHGQAALVAKPATGCTVAAPRAADGKH